jgi:flagellin
MANSIISNIAAFNAQGNIGRASNNASASIARLSSGSRITRASDDVAGLATGTALRTQVTTLRTALANAAQGSSLLQVADGALSQIVDILQRQKAIAVQASSGQLTDTNRSLLNQEFTSLTAEVDRISRSTNFNGVSLLAGGLGTSTRLVTTNALATTAVLASPSLQAANSGVVTASTTAIQAFASADAATPGTSRAGVGTAGFLQLTDSTGTVLANAQYDTVDASVYGQFSRFQFSNVNYGAAGTGSATLTATINGVQFSGNVVSNAAATAILQNGNTYINVALGAVTLTDASSTALAEANITNLFSTTVISRASTLQGVNFEGTALDGAIGIAATGNATLRLNTSGSVDISNFQYVGSTNAANSNTLTVQINGQTFTATNVNDQIAAGTLQFVDGGKIQALQINTTGLTTNITNIRTSLTDRTNFINALNQGFARAGNGLNFSIGSTATDTIRVQFGSATSSTIYNGRTLDVNTATNATAASTQLDIALNTVTSLRASVGALQSRFNFASNAIQSSIENQDSARSTLLDTDVSSESTAYSSAQVQLQAGIAVLAQANQLPQGLLKLIQ